MPTLIAWLILGNLAWAVIVLVVFWQAETVARLMAGVRWWWRGQGRKSRPFVPSPHVRPHTPIPPPVCQICGLPATCQRAANITQRGQVVKRIADLCDACRAEAAAFTEVHQRRDAE